MQLPDTFHSTKSASFLVSGNSQSTRKRQIKEDTSLQLHWLLPREKRWCCWRGEVLCKKVTQFLGTKRFDSPMEDGSSCLLLYMWASSTLFSFSMWSGKEVSLDYLSESSQWTEKITKVLSSLVLTCTPISNYMYAVDNALRFLEVIWYQFLNVQDSTAVLQWKFSSCMRSSRTIRLIIIFSS